MQYHIIGELRFTTTARRTTARTALAADALARGLVTTSFSSPLAAFATGLVDVTVATLPAIRMSYVTSNQAQANMFVGENFATRYNLGDNSWWTIVARKDQL